MELSLVVGWAILSNEYLSNVGREEEVDDDPEIQQQQQQGSSNSSSITVDRPGRPLGSSSSSTVDRHGRPVPRVGQPTGRLTDGFGLFREIC